MTASESWAVKADVEFAGGRGAGWSVKGNVCDDAAGSIPVGSGQCLSKGDNLFPARSMPGGSKPSKGVWSAQQSSVTARFLTPVSRDPQRVQTRSGAGACTPTTES